MATLSFGKRLIPAPLRPQAQRLYHAGRLAVKARLDQTGALLLEQVVFRYGFGQIAFFRLFSSAFLREERAVAAGRRAFADDRRAAHKGSFLLRRNIHRIEKGLIADGPARVFARDYILETVDELARFDQVSEPSAERIWAVDVLTAYFAAVPKSDSVVAQAHEAFQAILRPETNGLSAPYLRALDEVVPSIEALQALAIRRRSVRHCLDKPVDRTLVDKALDVARQAPSACNRQAFSFRIFDSAQAAQSVASLPMGTKSFLHNIQNVAVLVGHLRAYPYPRDRHAIYIDGGLAAMSFANGLEAQGLSSCMINWADQSGPDRAITKKLKLAADDRVIMLISFGWPDPTARVPFSAKRSLPQIRSFHAEV
ncbi:MAG: nitroreductase family protein [Pseudomonadota bacterium]